MTKPRSELDKEPPNTADGRPRIGQRDKLLDRLGQAHANQDDETIPDATRRPASTNK